MIEKVLERFSNYIWELYKDTCNHWDKHYVGCLYNLKKKQVKDIVRDLEIYYEILEYRNFLSNNMPRLINDLITLDFGVNIQVSSRVKVQNSIESKIVRYNGKMEKGNIPINKCLNDLFGIRIIVPTRYSCQEITDNLKLILPNYKIIDSSKLEYKAVHIYYVNGNKYFPWELQIWKESDMKNNYISHKEYKQEYTNWEKLSEEGE